jgi:hypothetical protein
MKRIFSSLILLAFPLAPIAAFAEEGGAGRVLPGGASTLIDLPPTKPGWVVETMFLNYQGDASVRRSFPIAGLLSAGLDARSDAFTLGGLYTLEPTLLGAHFSLGAFLPYVWMKVTADLQLGPLQRTRTDKANGIGDLLLMPAMLAWKVGYWQFDAFLPIYAPTGDYTVGQLANPGLNHWTFDPTVGVDFNHDKLGFNAALHTGFAISTENPDTNYRNGTVFHLDGSIQQLLPLGPGFVGVGVEGFYFKQITGDSGAGATLGGFEGSTAGVGPVLTYVLPVGKNTLVGEVRWLKELEAKRRLEGDYVWVKISSVQTLTLRTPTQITKPERSSMSMGCSPNIFRSLAVWPESESQDTGMTRSPGTAVRARVSETLKDAPQESGQCCPTHSKLPRWT